MLCTWADSRRDQRCELLGASCSWWQSWKSLSPGQLWSHHLPLAQRLVLLPNRKQLRKTRLSTVFFFGNKVQRTCRLIWSSSSRKLRTNCQECIPFSTRTRFTWLFEQLFHEDQGLIIRSTVDVSICSQWWFVIIHIVRITAKICSRQSQWSGLFYIEKRYGAWIACISVEFLCRIMSPNLSCNVLIFCFVLFIKSIKEQPLCLIRRKTAYRWHSLLLGRGNSHTHS